MAEPRKASDVLIPVYGFLEGDSMGLVIVMHQEETVGDFVSRLQDAANVRVGRRRDVAARYRGLTLDSTLTIREARILPLDRVDVSTRREDGVVPGDAP